MIERAYRALLLALFAVLIFMASGCARGQPGASETDLQVFNAVAAPSGNVYIVESDDYLGPYQYSILSRDGRKTKLNVETSVFGRDLDISGNDTLFQLRHEEDTDNYEIYQLSSAGKVLKTTSLPKRTLIKLDPESRLLDAHIRGFTVDNSENVYVVVVQETREQDDSIHYMSFLKKVSPDAEVTDINTKHMILWLGNVGDKACMAIDAENNLYVSEQILGTERIVIERFDPKGRGTIIANLPRGLVNPDTINIDRRGSIFVQVRGVWLKYSKGNESGVVVISDESSGPFRATIPYKPKTFGSTDVKLMSIDNMWRFDESN